MSPEAAIAKAAALLAHVGEEVSISRMPPTQWVPRTTFTVRLKAPGAPDVYANADEPDTAYFKALEMQADALRKVAIRQRVEAEVERLAA